MPRTAAPATRRNARRTFTTETGCLATTDNLAVVADSDVLLLAIKPQSMTALLAEIRPHVLARHLLVSIAAGVTLRQLVQSLA